MDQPTGGDTGPEPRARPRRVGLALALALFVLVVGVAGWAANHYRGCRAAPDPGPTVTFDVPEGATGQVVVQSLADAGLLRCGGFVGNLLLRGTGKGDEVLAGRHELTIGMTLDQILAVLTTLPDDVPTLEFVVPEGLRIASTFPRERSIASEVAEQLRLSERRFAQLAEGGTFSLPPYLPEGTSTTEGFLFPESYRLVKAGLRERDVIERMLEQFALEAEALPWSNAEALGLSPYEIVIVASMIEEEAKIDGDRALIAGVIYNRLSTPGWTLGIDATLLYRDPTPDGSLSTADIETDNPFNTRINGGLPPTPIASPGRESLRAALEPATTDFFFYVLCGGDGAHRFAVTLAEHNRNVTECLG